MRIEPKMGLRIWNGLEDPYDHEQLADNWAKIGSHDHTPGRGVQIPTQGIAEGAITNALLSTELSETVTQASKALRLATTIQKGAYAASAGDWVVQEVNELTTLPKPVLDASVGIFCLAPECEITASEGKIYGDFVSGATSLKFTQYQHAVFKGTGTNWLLVAGESKPEQTYSEFGHEVKKGETKTFAAPSATRRSLILVKMGGELAEEINAQIKVGGKLAGNALIPGTEGLVSLGMMYAIVNPGVEFTIQAISGTASWASITF